MDFKPKINHLRMGGMSFFLWWIMVAWEDDTRDYWLIELKKTLRRIRAKRIDRINMFAWFCDDNPRKKHGDNAHHNNKGPYEFVKDSQKWLINLSKFNKKWIMLARMFIKANYDICPEDPTDLQFIVHAPRYINYAYKNNVNNVTGYYTPEALKYKQRFARRLAKLIKSVHGDHSRTFFIFENEPECRAGYTQQHHAQKHKVADSHLGVYSAVKKNVPLRHIGADGSTCEFAFLPFIERAKCPKYGSNGCARYFGSDDNLDEKGKRQPDNIQHGSTLIENMKDGRLQVGLGSGCIYLEWHEDGGCSKQFFDIARGFKLRDKHGVVKYAWGDAQQVRQKCDYIWEASKKCGKDSFISICVPETLVMNERGIYIENFKVNQIDWTRFNQAIISHKKIYNHD